jgi:hypothetical protein
MMLGSGSLALGKSLSGTPVKKLQKTLALCADLCIMKEVTVYFLLLFPNK